MLQLQEFNHISLIKTNNDIVYNENASSYIGMSINSSNNLEQLYISHNLTKTIVYADFLPDNIPMNSFNNISTGSSHQSQPIIDLGLILHRQTQQTRCLIGYIVLATKSQQPTEEDQNNINKITPLRCGLPERNIKMKCDELKFNLHCDASWASHYDGNSYTGWELKQGQYYFR